MNVTRNLWCRYNILKKNCFFRKCSLFLEFNPILIEFTIFACKLRYFFLISFYDICDIICCTDMYVCESSRGYHISPVSILEHFDHPFFSFWIQFLDNILVDFDSYRLFSYILSFRLEFFYLFPDIESIAHIEWLYLSTKWRKKLSIIEIFTRLDPWLHRAIQESERWLQRGFYVICYEFFEKEFIFCQVVLMQGQFFQCK